jgi:hypothetical protein
VLRFADHRQPFIARLQQHLTRSIVDWEPDAWRLKLESSTTPQALAARLDGVGGAGSGSALADAAAFDTPAGLLQKNSKPRRAVRRRPLNGAIDEVLREIGQARPKDQRHVFQLLEGRVEPPDAQPFKRAGGWIAGFQKKPDQARVWLSKAWNRLELPRFRLGPK